MKYVGSKNSIAKYILSYILSERQKDQWYVEPFVGGANMIDKVYGNRIGADANYYLIEMFKALQNGWVPPKKIDEEFYNKIKNNKEKYDPALVSFVGFACSYGAKWFGGFRRSKKESRDYIDEAYRNVTKQNLKGIVFKNCTYDKLEIPNQSIVYCDPPYKNTVKYFNGEFNHDYFWEWCRVKVSQNHKVYISEYQAPYDFIPIWAKTKNNTLDKDTGSKKNIEKLFIHKSQQGSNFYF